MIWNLNMLNNNIKSCLIHYVCTILIKSHHIRKITFSYVVYTTLMRLQGLNCCLVPACILVGLVVVLEVWINLSGAWILTVLFISLVFLAKKMLHENRFTILGANVRSFSPLIRSHCLRLIAIYRLDCHSIFSLCLRQTLKIIPTEEALLRH